MYRTLWNVFFVLKKPRSEHASDEAVHGWFCAVEKDQQKLRKGNAR
jgi:hypothetical protein